MPNNLDRLGRAVNNLMTRVFEQGGAPKFNTRMSNTLQSRGSITLIEESYGLELALAGVAKYYADLTLAGSDTDADAGRYGITGATQRIQYGSGVFSPPAGSPGGTTRGWIVARIRPNWAAATAQSKDNAIFHWGTASQKVALQWQDSTNQWRMQRIGGGVTNNALSAVQTFIANTDMTIAAFWNPAEIGVSVNGGAFSEAASVNGSTSIPATMFDIGTSGAANQDLLSASVYWIAMGVGLMNDAIIADASWVSNTDPTAATMPSYGDIQPTFLWPGIDGTHTPLALFGEANYVS